MTGPLTLPDYDCGPASASAHKNGIDGLIIDALDNQADLHDWEEPNAPEYQRSPSPRSFLFNNSLNLRLVEGRENFVAPSLRSVTTRSSIVNLSTNSGECVVAINWGASASNCR